MNATDFISYSISQNGRFVFRTAEMMGMDWPVNWEGDIIARFPKAEGFVVTRVARPNGQISTDIS